MSLPKSKRSLVALALMGAAIGVGGAMSVALAEPQKSEYADYDDELMKDLDRTIKYFEPDVTAGNDAGVADDIAVLRQGFQYTEKYFAKRGNAPDAVKISQDGLKALDAVQQFMTQQNLEAAAAKARDVTDACKACHDVYKPKQARG
jgi:soluble cytochrome b562